MPAFKNDELLELRDALDISEDITWNYFKFSSGQWKRNQYDIKTLASLTGDEITQNAFALLNKGSRHTSQFDSKTKQRDFYFICLQDHRILDALQRDHKLRLFPLLVYILTHELVHVVRFCNFYQRYEVSGEHREREESLVHRITYDILKEMSLSSLEYVLRSYVGHRVCEFAIL
jgi:hypothetical protein